MAVKAARAWTAGAWAAAAAVGPPDPKTRTAAKASHPKDLKKRFMVLSLNIILFHLFVLGMAALMSPSVLIWSA
jgi:hypothetical protein